MRRILSVAKVGVFILAILLAMDAAAKDCKPSNVKELQVLAEALKPKPIVIGTNK